MAELATRDRALLEPTIHQMRTLYDLDALEAVLEEQARTATGRPGWLLEVYDHLGLVDQYIEKLRTARKWRDRAFAAELLGRRQRQAVLKYLEIPGHPDRRRRRTGDRARNGNARGSGRWSRWWLLWPG